MAKIGIVATLMAFPGKGQELVRYCQMYGPRFVASEQGTLRIELLLPFDEADKLVIWEVYESAAAIEAHRNGDLIREFRDGAKEILQSMSSVRHSLIE